MASKSNKSTLALLVAIFVIAGDGRSVSADAIDDFFKQLEKRRAECSTVYYKISGTRFDTKDAVEEGKGQDHTSPTELVFKLDFRNGWALRRVKLEYLDVDPTKAQTGGRSMFYDGSVAKLYKEYDPAIKHRLSQKAADIFVKKLGKEQEVPWLQPPDFPVFLYHGYLLSARNPKYRIQKITSADKNSFEVVGSTRVAEASCHVLRDTAQDGSRFEYAITESEDHLVLRMDCFRDRKLVVRTTIKPKKHGAAWIPKTWESLTFNSNGRLESSYKYSVEEVSLNEVYSKEDFQGERIQPGQIIDDADQNAYFQADSRGRLVQIVPDAPKTSSLLYQIVVIAIIMLLVVAGITWIRKKRSLRELPS